MPLATPTTFDGWPTNQPDSQGRAVAKAPDTEAFQPNSRAKTPTLVGQSPVMRKLFSVIERVAPTDASVLITGATGTGKELAARAIHNLSPRRDAAFVDINCSAIPETLIEAELFGHQRGTFTGAHENRSGLFEKASGGTLFLDEVDALNLSAQAKLLRVLQERTVRRIGARANIAIDVRIISATNCDLSQAVASGRFRPDLYYRLRVLPLHLPELCTRTGDVSLLVEHFLRLKSERQGRITTPRFTEEALRALNEYPWPGNVRELENAIERAVILCESTAISAELLGIDIELDDLDDDDFPGLSAQASSTSHEPTEDLSLEDYFQHFVLEHQDHMTETELARKLGISRKCLWERRQRLGIPRRKTGAATG